MPGRLVNSQQTLLQRWEEGEQSWEGREAQIIKAHRERCHKTGHDGCRGVYVGSVDGPKRLAAPCFGRCQDCLAVDHSKGTHGKNTHERCRECKLHRSASWDSRKQELDRAGELHVIRYTKPGEKVFL